MAHVRFLLSTGRTSTQNIASVLQSALLETVVEHEPLGPDYFARHVFRRPRSYFGVLGKHVPIQRKLIAIEDLLASGTSYIDVGWTCYAWLPYFADRFKDQLGFAHVVRNPFETATSHATHGIFVPGVPRGRRTEKIAVIHPEDPTVHFKKVAQNAAEFSPYEKNLFNWLEINQFALDQYERDGFIGLYRFEELYNPDDPKLSAFLTDFGGEADYNVTSKPVDKSQKILPTTIDTVDQQLLDAVFDLATRLGYSEDDLERYWNPGQLQQKYSARRR
ncbi:hypothetical protein [Ruegeria sp. R14_0]|uniref:hypothetical protein n=1 Tax=Ruegeria sp. R14_0 TaxID=2821100 RepID=UPI001ADB5E45|nr:hypothetical protein [Ruegeria sp. R14_0]MBO9447623.1 hypothetical protein [Ruegeria sp. R14_0]